MHFLHFDWPIAHVSRCTLTVMLTFGQYLPCFYDSIDRYQIKSNEGEIPVLRTHVNMHILNVNSFRNSKLSQNAGYSIFETQKLRNMLLDEMGMGWDGMAWDGMGWDAMRQGWNGMKQASLTNVFELVISGAGCSKDD